MTFRLDGYLYNENIEIMKLLGGGEMRVSHEAPISPEMEEMVVMEEEIKFLSELWEVLPDNRAERLAFLSDHPEIKLMDEAGGPQKYFKKEIVTNQRRSRLVKADFLRYMQETKVVIDKVSDELRAYALALPRARKDVKWRTRQIGRQLNS